jgi:uncharacterized protein
MNEIVLSHHQTAPLLALRGGPDEPVTLTPDLGRSQLEAAVEADGVRFPTGELLTWDAAEAIADDENGVYVLDGEGATKVLYFSELTNWAYSLFPTASWPSMLISGIPMHRIVGTDPQRDTMSKMAAIKPVYGRVLDTATGLGYTAIQAARSADHVTTIELDPTALLCCQHNPWSRELFDDERIEQLTGDTLDVLFELDDASYDRIIHDPPAFRLAGHLYSAECYRELHRVLARRGRCFHYIGDPDSPSGKSTTKGVMRRLQEAGFTRVVRRPRAFGVVAYK